MIDIAQRVGVSKGAVASVLSDVGKNVIRVGEAKRQEILRVAKEMNYVPDMTARALAGKSGMKIGALIDSQAPRCTYRILWAIEEAAVKAGYRLMIGQAHDDPQSLFDCYDNFMCHGIDGVVCLAHEYQNCGEKVRSFFQNKRNLVFYEPPGWEVPYVGIDRTTGMVQAVRHLQETGRQRIGLCFLCDKDYHSHRQRIAAYRESNRGGEFIRMGVSPSSYVDEILAEKLDAVIASNDRLAAQVTRELMRRGIRVPEDVAIIGHDNDDFSEFYYPSLSTIDQNDEAVGQKIFDLLMALLKTEPLPGDCVFTTKLIIRESSFKATGGSNEKEG